MFQQCPHSNSGRQCNCYENLLIENDRLSVDNQLLEIKVGWFAVKQMRLEALFRWRVNEGCVCDLDGPCLTHAESYEDMVKGEYETELR